MNNTTVIDTGFVTDSTTEVVYMVFNFNYFLNMIIKLLLSTAFSFIIGLEREMHSHPGGICTHILVGYGSCLFTMVSVNLRNAYPQQGSGSGENLCSSRKWYGISGFCYYFQK